MNPFYPYGGSALNPHDLEPPSTCGSSFARLVHQEFTEAAWRNWQAVVARSYAFLPKDNLTLTRNFPVLPEVTGMSLPFPTLAGAKVSPVDSITAGIHQLYYPEFARFLINGYLNRVRELGQFQAKAATKEIMREAESGRALSVGSTFPRGESGIIQIPYLEKHRDFIMSSVMPSAGDFGVLGPAKQIGKVSETLKQDVASRTKELTNHYLTEMRARAVELIQKQIAAWETNPKFGIDHSLLQNLLNDMFVEYAGKLQAIHPLSTTVLTDKGPLTDSIPDSLVYLDGGKLKFTVPTKGVAGEFDPSFGAVVMGSKEGYFPNENGVILALHHGAGFLSSTIASWADPIPRLADWGFNPIAIDLPWSLGPELGIAMDSIRNPIAVANYCGTWHSALVGDTHHRSQVVTFDRSFGSTAQFSTALVNHIVNGGSERVLEGAVSYVLTSFSNPWTIDDQVANIQEQLKAGNRAALKGVVPETIDYVVRFDQRLMALLERVQRENPKALNSFGDELLFINGEADADGGPRKGSRFKDVAHALVEFRNQFAPRGHVYILPDPLKQYPQAAHLIDLDQREAAHYLMNNRPNVSEAEARSLGLVAAGISEADWPKFADQRIEVIALTYAFLDYLLDASPFPGGLPRDSLREQRWKLTDYENKGTDHDNKGAFLRWYVNRLNALSKNQPPLDLEIIRSDAVHPGRGSVAERIKRVIVYFEQETARAHRLIPP
ncbi:MAG: hypothetical protein HY537_16010 [Deltaproteobacteria bacterium]|nr:hypothetical protein [Deltaproteobacteria bacterium]